MLASISEKSWSSSGCKWTDDDESLLRWHKWQRKTQNFLWSSQLQSQRGDFITIFISELEVALQR